MNRSRTVWYILGGLALVLVIGGVVWYRGQLAVDQKPFPDWELGARWQYELVGAETITIPDFAGERLIQATTLERTVVGQATVDNLSLFLIADRYFSDDGEQTVQVLFIDADTLSTYLEEDIIRAGLRKRTLALPLEENKTWTVRPGWVARVTRQERINLDGRVVETYRVEYVQNGTEWSVWYAPEAKTWVRFDVQEGQFQLANWRQMEPQEAIDRVYDDLEVMSRYAPASTLQALEVLKRHGIGLERNAEISEEMTKGN